MSNFIYHIFISSVAKWQNCNSITLYIEENFGDDVTRIAYIGLKGSFKEVYVAVQFFTPTFKLFKSLPVGLIEIFFLVLVEPRNRDSRI
tara:strand:+ start:195 stop:461 length:267 start_codon:yes stop_codon:yes gene_type:complete